MSSFTNIESPPPLVPLDKITSLEEGREELKKTLFNLYDYELPLNGPEHALEIMTKFPILASEKISSEYISEDRYPLRLLIFHYLEDDNSTSNLDIIKKTFDLCPNALEPKDFMLVISNNKGDINNEILFYLLDQKSDILSQIYGETIGINSQVFRETILIHYILSAKNDIDTETRKLIVKKYPFCHNLKDQHGRYLLHAYMMSVDSFERDKVDDSEFLDYMVDNFPSDVHTFYTRFGRDTGRIDPIDMGDIHVGAILRIIPQLTELSLDCVTWRGNALERFFQAMKDFQSLQKLILLVDRQLFGANNALYDLMEESMAANKSICELTLIGSSDFHRETITDSEAFSCSSTMFDSIVEGVTRMTNLKVLKLKHFATISRDLLSFIANGGAPPTLHLYDFTILGKSSQYQPLQWKNSRLKSFVFDNVTRPLSSMYWILNLSSRPINDLLQEISKAPHLTDALLRLNNRPDLRLAKDTMTTRLIQLMQNSSLKILALYGASILVVDQLVDALNENDNLTHLTVSFGGVFDTIGTTDFVNRLAEALKENNNLTHLNVSFCTDFRDTAPVNIDKFADMLKENNNLTHLTVSGCTVDIDKLIEALKENNNLTHLNLENTFINVREHSLLLDVLKNFNTTLGNIELYKEQQEGESDGKIVQEIIYWSNLNSHGRKHVRDPKTTLLHFLGLLENSMKVENDPDGLKSFNCQYYLLRTIPSLWSKREAAGVNSSREKKRKRNDDD